MKIYPTKLLDVCSLEKFLKFAYKQRTSPLLMHIPGYPDRNPETDILRQCRDKLSADNICKASAGEIPWMILGQKRALPVNVDPPVSCYEFAQKSTKQEWG